MDESQERHTSGTVLCKRGWFFLVEKSWNEGLWEGLVTQTERQDERKFLRAEKIRRSFSQLFSQKLRILVSDDIVSILTIEGLKDEFSEKSCKWNKIILRKVFKFNALWSEWTE